MDSEWDTARGLLTDADDLFDLNAGGVNLFGEFAHSLVGVLVRERVHIDPHPCGWMDGWVERERARECKREREAKMNARTNSSADKKLNKREASVFYLDFAGFFWTLLSTLVSVTPLFYFTRLLLANSACVCVFLRVCVKLTYYLGVGVSLHQNLAWLCCIYSSLTKKISQTLFF